MEPKVLALKAPARPGVAASRPGLEGKEDCQPENHILIFEAATLPSFVTVIPIIAGSMSLAGCVGAPSYELFGAYFPAWMFSALVGIIGAIVARVAIGIDGILPFRLFVCVSAGLVVGTLAWLFWFGR
ncbi:MULTISPECIES: hypothetical protein [Bradyrhizobium]|uniref:hypothetical protein n=1 Tax=Bradyrhizobium TaxID=374 RepID=UPI001FCCDD4F|nr:MULTISPECIES: hypothetical protein [Bradyrhizobium]